MNFSICSEDTRNIGLFVEGYSISRNKHFESSQKLLKSSFVNERFKKYSMLPNELLTFETTNFIIQGVPFEKGSHYTVSTAVHKTSLQYSRTQNQFTVHLYTKPVYSIVVHNTSLQYPCAQNQLTLPLYRKPVYRSIVHTASLQNSCTQNQFTVA